MKKLYHILSFVITVGFVLYLQYLYSQNGMDYKLPKHLEYTTYIVVLNSIVATVSYFRLILKKKNDETVW